MVMMTDGNQDMIFNNLQIEERNRIKQIRLNDLSQI
jgi:hypothetical protein